MPEPPIPASDVASPSVLAGLSPEQIRHAERPPRPAPLTAEELARFPGLAGIPPPRYPCELLPGEQDGDVHSVYRITFAHGAQYVGITSRSIIDRLEQHFGGSPWGDYPAPALEHAARQGLGTPAIVQRAAAGVSWSVEVLASGLSATAARARERAEIAVLEKPLNAIGAARGWCDPLAPDPRQSALIRYLPATIPFSLPADLATVLDPDE